MGKVYKVVDLYKFCKIKPDMVYLIIEEYKCFRSINTSKKVHTIPDHHLEIIFGSTEPISVIYQDVKTGRYSVSTVPCSSNIYRFLEEKKLNQYVPDYDVWENTDYRYRNYVEFITMYDNVVRVDGTRGRKRLMPTDNGRFEDTDICLKKICYDSIESNADKTLFDKLVNGCTITARDFEELLESPKTQTDIDLGNLQFNVDYDTVTIIKTLGEPAEVEEEIVFRFRKKRVPNMTMFLDFVLSAESENKLAERISKYFVF